MLLGVAAIERDRTVDVNQYIARECGSSAAIIPKWRLCDVSTMTPLSHIPYLQGIQWMVAGARSAWRRPIVSLSFSIDPNQDG